MMMTDLQGANSYNCFHFIMGCEYMDFRAVCHSIEILECAVH